MIMDAALQLNAISVIRQLPEMLILSHAIAAILKFGGYIEVQLTQLSLSSQNTFILMFGSLTHFCSFKFYFEKPFFIAFDEAAILKSGVHLGFLLANVLFLESTSWPSFVPNLVLVSPSERFH